MLGQRTPQTAGVSHFYYVGASVALSTVVAPAANTKGVTVTGAGAWATNPNNRSRVMFVAGTPSGVDDAAVGTLALAQYNSAGQMVRARVNLPVTLLPGVGLFAQKNDAGVETGYFVDYIQY